jgi:hypothetical protein
LQGGYCDGDREGGGGGEGGGGSEMMVMMEKVARWLL